MASDRNSLGQFTPQGVSGELNNRWAGDAITYSGVHQWVRKTFGKASECEDCGSTANVQWANLSREYKRNRSDWKQLCQVCHWGFDKIAKLTKQEAAQIRAEYAEGGISQTSLGVKYGVSQMVISRLIRNIQKFYA